MASLVTAEDFSLFLGIETPTIGSLKRRKMDFLLNEVSTWVRDLAKKAWTLPGEEPPTARGIILASARREWNNPKRISYLVKGPQYAMFMPTAYPAGFFTDAEERYLRNLAGSTGDMWTQEICRDDIQEMNGYLEIYPQGGLMPVYAPGDIGYEDSIHP
jgi:hypothetical protein